MKNFLIILLAVCLAACSDSTNPEPEPNYEVNAKITSPSDKATHFLDEDLIISGTGSSEKGEIKNITLTIGDKTAEDIIALPFKYTISKDDLKEGELKIKLTVTDEAGKSASDEIVVTIKKALVVVSEDTLQFGYWTQEQEYTFELDSEWMMSATEDNWMQIYDPDAGRWVAVAGFKGEPNQTVKLRSVANELFEPKKTVINVIGDEQRIILECQQDASVDIIELIEDKMFRMAVHTSCSLYGLDENYDGKISAWEAEQELDIFGIDAGSWDVESIKGIENFKTIKHLDLNRNPIEEVDLSLCPQIWSLHLQFCPNVKSVDLSLCPNLIEVGAEFELFLTFPREIIKEYHTLAALNRKEDHPVSTLDFQDFQVARLYVNDNGLTDLNVKGCKNLHGLSAGGNKFKELDLSDVDRDTSNYYILSGSPELEKVYVWKGFTRDYYWSFSVDDHVQIIEK